jgi:predicted nucleotidyltransferase
MTKEYVKNYRNEMQMIKEKIEEINAVVVTLPISSWRGSLEVTMVNFEKKINAFLEVSAELTTEQKEAIARIKKGEIPAFSSRVEEQQNHASDMEADKGKSGKGKKH